MRLQKILISALILVIGIAIGVIGSNYSGRATLVSLSPNGLIRVWMVEKPNFIDRNFTLQVENLREHQFLTIFHSPDEGKPIGSERFIWAADSSRFLLIGRHFFVNKAAALPGDEYLYLMYEVRSARLWCNSVQQSMYPSFSREDVLTSEWQNDFNLEA